MNSITIEAGGRAIRLEASDGRELSDLEKSAIAAYSELHNDMADIRMRLEAWHAPALDLRAAMEGFMPRVDAAAAEVERFSFLLNDVDGKKQAITEVLARNPGILSEIPLGVRGLYEEMRVLQPLQKTVAEQFIAAHNLHARTLGKMDEFYEGGPYASEACPGNLLLQSLHADLPEAEALMKPLSDSRDRGLEDFRFMGDWEKNYSGRCHDLCRAVKSMGDSLKTLLQYLYETAPKDDDGPPPLLQPNLS